VYNLHLPVEPCENCATDPEAKLYGAVRQHEDKIFLLNLDADSDYCNQECLLFDFNLSNVDTMYITEKSFFIKLAEISSSDGKKVYSYFLTNYFFNDSPSVYFVEGIGCSFRLKYFVGPGFWSSRCFRINQISVANQFGGLSSGCVCQDCPTSDIGLQVEPSPRQGYSPLHLQFYLL